MQFDNAFFSVNIGLEEKLRYGYYSQHLVLIGYGVNFFLLSDPKLEARTIAAAYFDQGGVKNSEVCIIR